MEDITDEEIREMLKPQLRLFMAFCGVCLLALGIMWMIYT